MTLGQPDFHTPENIQDAAVKAIREGQASFYTVASGLPELKAAVNTYFERYYEIILSQVTRLPLLQVPSSPSILSFMAVINPL